MVNANDEKLIQELMEKTTAGKLRWTTSADPNEFFTNVRGYSVTVRANQLFSEYQFTLRDAEDNDLMNIIHEGESSTLASLCEVARRNAHNVGQKVSDLLVELGRL